MKYIIKENRLGDIINKYLNDHNYYYWDNGDGEFSISEKSTGRDMVRVSFTLGVNGFPEYNAYFRPSMIKDIENLFGLESGQVFGFLMNWINSEYGANLPKENYGFLETGEEY